MTNAITPDCEHAINPAPNASTAFFFLTLSIFTVGLNKNTHLNIMYICPAITDHAILFHGKKVLDFLQGMCTSNVDSLQTSQALATTFCQHQGKLVALGTLAMLSPEQILFIGQPCTLSTLLDYLHPFLQLSRVTASIEKITCFGLIQAHQNSERTPYHVRNQSQFSLISIAKNLSIGFTLDPSHTLNPSSFGTICSLSFWHAHLIQNHIPILTKNTLSQFTPNMLGLVPSMRVSLQKGCYCGQEIIARSHHLGKAKRQLLTFTTTYELPSLQPGQTQYLSLPKSKEISSRKITILFGAAIQNTHYIQACGPILQASDPITLSQKPEDCSATAISVTPV
ncbi:MAG: hypothetical protein VX737_04145 [Pseudomonadota bacterium]|nr:hypothetical protein [Pseudomonadota bacterium]